jgi:hypothetical protein
MESARGRGKRSPWPACSRTIVPVNIVWVGLQLSCLPRELVHIAVFDKENYMSWSVMRWLWLKLFSATTDLSGCMSQICSWCCFILLLIDQPVCLTLEGGIGRLFSDIDNYHSSLHDISEEWRSHLHHYWILKSHIWCTHSARQLDMAFLCFI